MTGKTKARDISSLGSTAGCSSFETQLKSLLEEHVQFISPDSFDNATKKQCIAVGKQATISRFNPDDASLATYQKTTGQAVLDFLLTCIQLCIPFVGWIFLVLRILVVQKGHVRKGEVATSQVLFDEGVHLLPAFWGSATDSDLRKTDAMIAHGRQTILNVQPGTARFVTVNGAEKPICLLPGSYVLDGAPGVVATDDEDLVDARLFTAEEIKSKNKPSIQQLKTAEFDYTPNRRSFKRAMQNFEVVNVAQNAVVLVQNTASGEMELLGPGCHVLDLATQTAIEGYSTKQVDHDIVEDNQTQPVHAIIMPAKGSNNVIVSSFIQLKINDPVRFNQVENPQKVVNDIARSNLIKIVASMHFSDLGKSVADHHTAGSETADSPNPPDYTQSSQQQVHNKFLASTSDKYKEMGIEVVDICLTRVELQGQEQLQVKQQDMRMTNLERENAIQTGALEKQKLEQMAGLEKLRIEVDSAGQMASVEARLKRAQVEAQVKQTEADAEAKAIRTRGQAEADVEGVKTKTMLSAILEIVGNQPEHIIPMMAQITGQKFAENPQTRAVFTPSGDGNVLGGLAAFSLLGQSERSSQGVGHEPSDQQPRLNIVSKRD